jgi:small GTP-binding protein
MVQNETDIKIIIIGCSGVGKTSFVQRWIKGYFEKVYRPTIVSDFQYKILEWRGKCYRILLWDIGGQDKTPSMAKIFTRNSHGCIVINDISKKDNFNETMKWKKVVYDESAFIDGDKLPFILIQNKIDLLEGDKDYLNKAMNESQKLVDSGDFIGYFMTSVKENINIDEPIKFLIDNIIDRLDKFQSSGNHDYNVSKMRNTYRLENNNKKDKNKKDGCC